MVILTTKTLNDASKIWQNGTGASWQHIEYANTGDNHASYCYPLGKNHKSQYKPKTVYYQYKVTGINATTHKIDTAKFILILGKFNIKENDLPTIKVYSGSVNTTPLQTIKNYKKLANPLPNDSYTLEYEIKGLTVNQLKNVIVEVDWSKTKTTAKSTISINRAYFKAIYSPKTPIWTLYDSISNDNPINGQDIGWTVIAKNTGANGTKSVNITIPDGFEVIGHDGDGTFENGVWTFGDNGTKRISFLLRCLTVGRKVLSADTLEREVYVQFNNTKPQAVGRDAILYNFYDTYQYKDRQYFDVTIYGFGANHPNGKACYTITTSNHVILDTPLHDNNVYNFSSDSNVYSVDNTTTDNQLCLNVEPNENFVAVLRLHMRCEGYSGNIVGEIVVTDSQGNTTTGFFPVLPQPKMEVKTIAEYSRDISHVQQSVNIGSPEVWTINLESSKTNFFEEKPNELEINIEEPIAYIGCVPVQRCHSRDVKANTTNSLIDTNYLNRRYMGKQGDYKEEIPMTLRIKKQDVATLQGLVAMDKPIPIDLIPSLLDGDPLNHRGWAEIYGVKNIHKINDMLYECDVNVAYLTHELLTRFKVNKGKPLTDKTIDFLLDETLPLGANLTERFDLNYSQLFWNEENTNGDLVGAYEIPPVSNLVFKSKEPLNSYSDYNIIFSNTLPMYTSEDYDGNWEMAIRLRDSKTDNVVFEHLYNNFKHYDFKNEVCLNQCDVTTRAVGKSDGVYDLIHHDTHQLKMNTVDDEVGKIPTYFNRIGDITFDDYETDNIEIFLLDKDNNQLRDKSIEVTFTSEDNTYNETFYDMTDLYGRCDFPVKLSNGEYIVTFKFKGDDTYRSCEYQVSMTVDYDEIAYHFEYDGVSTISSLNDTYEVQLLDMNDDVASGYTVHYSFRNVGSENYTGEKSLVTDSNGKIQIPLEYTNGSTLLKVIFKGFIDDEEHIHQPTFFEDVIEFAVTGEDTVLEADDITFMQGEYAHDYFVTLKDSKGQVMANKTVMIAFSNMENTFSFNKTTNQYGVASVPLYLNRGVWTAHILYSGDTDYKCCSIEKTVTVTNLVQRDTYMVSNKAIFDEEEILSGDSELYTVTLKDFEDKVLSDKSVQIKVYDTDDTLLIDTIRFTDTDGKVEVPYISHNEQVKVNLKFLGDSFNKPCEYTENVLFKDVTGKADVDVEVNIDWIDKSVGWLETYWLDASVNITYSDTPIDLEYDVITINSNNGFDNLDGDYLNYLIGNQNYKVTVLVYGNETYYSKAITFDISLDKRNSRPHHNGGYSLKSIVINDTEYTTNDTINAVYGDVYKLRYSSYKFCRKYWSEMGETIGCVTNTKVNSFGEEYDIELIGIISSNDYFTLNGRSSVSYTYGYEIDVHDFVNVSSGDLSNNDLSFNLNKINKTYTKQNISTQTNDYVILYCYNHDTLTLHTYYTYIDDDGKVDLDVPLIKGNWSFGLLGQGKSNYKDIFICNMAEIGYPINTDPDIEPPSDTTGDLDFSEIAVMPSNPTDEVFGSNLYLQLRGNILDFSDYGMVKDAEGSGGIITIPNRELPLGEYYLELAIDYKNTQLNRLNDLTGHIQIGISEDVNNSDGAKEYGNLIVSPMPLSEGITKFTRHTDEGTMYYVRVNDDEKKSYICNPYIQYKGGTEMQTIDGISIFNLDNGYSPVFVNNGLVGAEFHRRSGYIRLSRYDERTGEWFNCNTLKLDGSPKLELESNYTDDSIEIKFGSTTWKLWRGRPFIVLKHKDDDLRILNLVDHVYCETLPNQMELGFIEKQSKNSSIFNVYKGLQLFPHELHIGENIRTDNFKLYEMSETNRIVDEDLTSTIEVTNVNHIPSIHVNKQSNKIIGLNFSASPYLVKKPSDDTFSLSMEHLYVQGADSIKVKIRGFDDRGVVYCDNNIQYGLYEHTQTVPVFNGQWQSISGQFLNLPRSVKYIDFTIILPTGVTDFKMNNIMLYNGDSEIGHAVDTSTEIAKNTMINFDETYISCLYNEDDPFGLAFFRMDKDSFTLNKLYKAEETVIVPYMKVARECDDIENIFLEYLNSNDQVVDISWEDK